jgi:hypothetical protein
MKARAGASLALPAAFAAVCLGVAFFLKFQQFHNDYWDVHFVASHLSFADPSSVFNPQYPIGYILLLKALLGFGSAAVPAILLNIAFTCGTVWMASRLYLRLLPPVFAIFALLALCVYPDVFHYAVAGGGDPGSVFFFVAGAVLLLTRLHASSSSTEGGARPFFLAGVLFGLSALFRYHALVAAVLLGAALLAVYPRYWKSGIFTVAGATAVYSAQWAANLFSGHGLMETQFGPMNVYDLMHGLNWHRITSLALPGSVGDIIAADPALFLRRYAAAIWSFKHAWAPAVLAALLLIRFERDPRVRRVAWAIALWCAAYFLLFSATTSGRQALLAVPLTFLSLGLSARILWTRLAVFRNPMLPCAAATLFAAALLGLHLARDVAFVRDVAERRDECLAVESFARASGVRDSRQVFTSDFNLYFRGFPTPIPYFNGGAPRLGTYRYNEMFPEFPVDAPAEFLAACRARGVRLVVLDPDSRRLSAPLADLYDGRTAHPGLAFEHAAGRYRVYRVL